MQNRIAVLDLGTNTFHLQIAEIKGNLHTNLFKEKLPVMIGKGGISKGYITEEAQERAVDALVYFKQQSEVFKVRKIIAIATSAFRNAKNGKELAHKILTTTGIEVQIVDGEEEAGLIYDGVSLCIPDMSTPHLVIDIGGGSVEFIIGFSGNILWKTSLEIGGQRLMDRFHYIDPIPESSLEDLYAYLDLELAPIYEAIRTYNPQVFIGSSGSFDTLDEIYRKQSDKDFDIEEILSDHLPVRKYYEIFEALRVKNRAERLRIPGMIPLRADMIVVACCLINKVIEKINTKEIVVSTCSLKEGVIKRHMGLKFC